MAEPQARLVQLAEREAVYAALDLTPEDEVLLAKARADFAGRRTVTLSECDADLDAYFAAMSQSVRAMSRRVRVSSTARQAGCRD